MHDWSFFDVPRMSRAQQSLAVWSGKVIHGWPLILRNSFALIQRFVLGRMPPAR